MKTISIGFLLLLSTFSFGQILPQPPVEKTDSVAIPFEQRMQQIFQNVNMSAVTTHLLIDKAVQLCPAENYDGVTLNTEHAVTYSTWQNLYGTLFSAALQTQYRLPDPRNSYLAVSNIITQDNPIPISIIDFNYHKLKEDVLENGILTENNDNLYDVPNASESAFQMKYAFSATPVINNITQENVQFVLQGNMVFSNTGKTISSVQIDFSDGDGFKTLALNSPVSINYTSNGKKYIQIKVNFTDLSFSTCYALISVKLPEEQSSTARYFNPQPSVNFVSSRSFAGHNAGAKVTVGLGCGNDKLRKPFIVIEGYDPPQLGNYGLLHYDGFQSDLVVLIPNTSNTLRQELENGGYDLVYIDFANGSDYIEANAYVVEDIINWVNQQKALNGSNEDNVVMGESMGGLIGRYALREMELLNQNHQTRKFISFDTPHLEANVPLGYQEMVADLCSTTIGGIPITFFSPDLQDGIDILNSPASRELLAYHYDPVGSMPIRNSLYNWFAQNGFPNCEIIAIANGSQVGQDQGYNPHSMLLKIVDGNMIILPIWGIPAWVGYLYWMLGTGFHVFFQVNALPNNPSSFTQIYKGFIFAMILDIPVVYSNTTVKVKNNLPFDSAPGGVWDAEAFGFDLSQLTSLPANISVPYTSFCFMPSVSSLDLLYPYNQNLYVNIQNLNIVGNNLTPFARYSSPIVPSVPSNSTNEFHTFFTTNNTPFFDDELIDFSNSLSTVSGYPNLNGISYNYGKNATQRTTDRISESININANSVICVNCNQNLGLATDNLYPPTTASTFDAYIGNLGCFPANAIVTINQGGQFIIGDNSTLNRGIVRCKSGSTIVINNGGKLIINDNSTLIIEEGARIIYDAGAQIQLLGNNAVLDIQGILQIAPNATFTFTFPGFPSGYVKFDRPGYNTYDINNANYQIQIQNSPGAKMEFVGANQNDKVLEVNEQLWIPDQLSSFKINKGKVEFAGNNFAGVSSLSIGCPLILTNSSFTTSNNAHAQGIYLWGNSHTIQNCKFTNLQQGISSFNSVWGNPLKVTASSFTNCVNAGIRVEDKGVILSSCTFTNCYDGLQSNLLTFPSTLVNCSFKNCEDFGVVDVNTIGNLMSFENCQIDDNLGTGIYANGSTMNVSCSNINRNGNSGFFIEDDASLQMSNNPPFSGGYNSARLNGQATCVLKLAGNLELNGGYNDFRVAGQAHHLPCYPSNYTGYNVDFAGSFYNGPSNLNVYNNQWQSPASYCTFQWSDGNHTNELNPKLNFVTNVPLPFGSQVLFSDPSQIIYSPCTIGQPPPSQMQISPLNNCSNCSSIYTAHFPNTLTGDAARIAINQMDTTIVNGDSLAVEMFNEILMYSISNPTSDDNYVTATSIRKMHEAFQNGLHNGQIHPPVNSLSVSAQQIVQVEQQEQAAAISQGDYYKRFFSAMREAETYRADGKRSFAIYLFNQILLFAQPAEKPLVNFWICMTTNENEVLTGQIAKELFFTVMPKCALPISPLAQSNLRMINPEDESSSGTLNAVSVLPNPASESVSILFIQQDASVTAIFELYSLDGQLVKKQTLQGGSTFEMPIGEIPAGVYLYMIREGETIIQRDRLVIIH